MKNKIAQIIGEVQTIRNLLRNGNLSFLVTKGLNKEIEIRQEMLSEIEEFN
jgi:hypothetical protein